MTRRRRTNQPARSVHSHLGKRQTHACLRALQLASPPTLSKRKRKELRRIALMHEAARREKARRIYSRRKRESDG